MTLQVRDPGPPGGAPLVLIGTIGTDDRLWDDLIAILPPGLRVVSLSLPGHRDSPAPAPPYPMGALVSAVERTFVEHGLQDAVVMGLGFGGMLAQALAVKRLDLVRALILCGSATKIGTTGMWDARIEALRTGGIEAIADDTLRRWYGRRGSREGIEVAREMLDSRHPDAVAGCMAALSGTDLMAPTATLRLPTLALAGTEDEIVPPDLVRETAALVPAAEVQLIRGAGHLTPLQAPAVTAAHLSGFLERIAHV